MKHIYIRREGDRDSIIKNYSHYSKLNNSELIQAYNKQVKCGIVGAHAQALDIIALRKAFLERFNKSPVTIEDEIIIGLSGKIREAKNSYYHMEKASFIFRGGIDKDVYLNSILEIEKDFVDISKSFNDKTEAVLLEIKHPNIVTTINLTNISPYVLLFFDEELFFKGTSYSINSGSGNYTIQTQYKNILVIRMPLEFDLNKIIRIFKH